MNEERTTGLVLRTRPLTETSLIVQWITSDFGRIATVAKGARRQKSPFRGKLDLYFSSSLSFARSKRGDLHTLREVSTLSMHSSIRSNVDYLEQLAYCARLLEQTTEIDTPIPELFELTLGLVEHIGQHPPTPASVFAFELKLLHCLGMEPDWNQSHLSLPSRQGAIRLTFAPWKDALSQTLHRDVTKALQYFLHGFVIYHLGKIPARRMEALGLAKV